VSTHHVSFYNDFFYYGIGEFSYYILWFYAVEMVFYEAIKKKQYTCFVKERVTLPMMYMLDFKLGHKIFAYHHFDSDAINKIQV